MKEVFLGSSCVYTLNTDITSVQKLDYVYYICVYTLNTEITSVHNLLMGYDYMYMFMHLKYLCQILQVYKTWLQVYKTLLQVLQVYRITWLRIKSYS